MTIPYPCSVKACPNRPSLEGIWEYGHRDLYFCEAHAKIIHRAIIKAMADLSGKYAESEVFG